MEPSREPSRTERAEVLAKQLAGWAATVDAAIHKLLTAIREFGEISGWYCQGATTYPQWLSWRVGMGPGEAREKVRVAMALGTLPQLDAALSRGEISYSKVRAMTRVATPDNEATLLNMARHSTAYQLEKICRLFRECKEREAKRGKPEDREYHRWVSSRSTDDGMVRLSIQLRPEEAARVLKAIRVSAEASGTTDSADGLMAMTEATLRGDAPERSPTEVILNIDAGDLSGQDEEGRGVSAETCRRLLCDAGIVPALVDERGNTLDLGRKRRTVHTALRRALRLRDKGCRFPGCTHTRWVDAHHIEHWSHGGRTAAENLILMCSKHHRFVHEYGFTVRGDPDGELVFVAPDGRPIPVVPDRPKPSAIEPLPADTNMPHWDGKPPQYHRCVDVLLN